MLLLLGDLCDRVLLGERGVGGELRLSGGSFGGCRSGAASDVAGPAGAASSAPRLVWSPTKGAAGAGKDWGSDAVISGWMARGG